MKVHQALFTADNLVYQRGIDAGTATSLQVTGLTNGNLYYFAVVAYDISSPRQQSDFGAEVSARPSRIYK